MRWHGRCSPGDPRYIPPTQEEIVTIARRALPLLFLSLLLGLSPAHAQVEQATFDLPAVRDPQLGAQIAIADQLGYFKDEGLTVTVKGQEAGGAILTPM